MYTVSAEVVKYKSGVNTPTPPPPPPLLPAVTTCFHSACSLPTAMSPSLSPLACALPTAPYLSICLPCKNKCSLTLLMTTPISNDDSRNSNHNNNKINHHSTNSNITQTDNINTERIMI